jgi:hypothetical protein
MGTQSMCVKKDGNYSPNKGLTASLVGFYSGLHANCLLNQGRTELLLTNLDRAI